jgi:hypothetical protein
MENFKEKVEELLGVNLDDLNINETGEFIAVRNNVNYKININTEEIISPEDSGFKEISDKNKETFKERVQRVTGVDLDVASLDENGVFIAMFEDIKYRVNTKTEVIEIIPDLTFGQKAVGLTFNPSGDEVVTRAKQLSAELIDLVEAKRQIDLDMADFLTGETKQVHQQSWLSNVFRTAAFNAIIAAQMAVVKFLTYRD